MILVKHLLETAQKRLAVLSVEASLFDAARILTNRDTPLVVVCDSGGLAVGVIASGPYSMYSPPRGLTRWVSTRGR